MSATLREFGDAIFWQTPLQEVYPHDDESPDLDTNKCGESLDLAHIHILVFEPLVYHLLFFNYFVCQLLRIPTTV